MATYNTGTYSIAGCTVEISNTTIEPNTTVRIHGQQSVVLKPGFHAKAGSNVKITAGGGIVSKSIDNSIDTASYRPQNQCTVFHPQNAPKWRQACAPQAFGLNESRTVCSDNRRYELKCILPTGFYG